MKVRSNDAQLAQLRRQQMLDQAVRFAQQQQRPTATSNASAQTNVQRRMMESSFEAAPAQRTALSPVETMVVAAAVAASMEDVGAANAAAPATQVQEPQQPQLTDAQMRQALESMGFKAKHVKKASAAHVKQLFDQMQQKLTTPGNHKLTVKLGKKKYKVNATVGQDGTITNFSVKQKKGFLSKLGGALKKIGGIALKVASFIPGPIGIAARVANGVIGAVQGIKNGNILGGIASAAGAVAGGITGFGGKVLGSTAQTIANGARFVETAANTASNALAAIQQRNWGGLLGVISGGASDVAGLVGNGAGSFARTMETISTWANRGQAALNAVSGAGL